MSRPFVCGYVFALVCSPAQWFDFLCGVKLPRSAALACFLFQKISFVFCLANHCAVVHPVNMTNFRRNLSQLREIREIVNTIADC